MGAVITIILIVLVVKFAFSQPYNFEGALSYWFILIVQLVDMVYLQRAL